MWAEQGSSAKEKKSILPKYTEMTLGTRKQMATTSKHKFQKKKKKKEKINKSTVVQKLKKITKAVIC